MSRRIEGLPGPGVVLRIGRLYKPGMSDDEVYDAVRGSWVIGPQKREELEFVVAVAGGTIRGVYRNLSWVERKHGERGWQQDVGKAPKWRFDGEPASELAHLIGRDVSDLFPRGSANPVTYVNF